MNKRTGTTQLVRITLLLGLLCAGLGLARPARAADEVVGNGTAVSCSEATFAAALATVQGSGGGTITFDCGGAVTIPFSGSKIISQAAVTINGAEKITLDGRDVTRFFHVEEDAGLTLQNITLANGFDNTSGGGAILNLGEVTLQNVTIRDSHVDPGHSGGAIMSLGPLTLTDSLIEANTGGSAGGLFLFGEAADATISGSTFRSNSTTNPSYGLGGAVTPWDGADVLIRGSTFVENKARKGGAFYNESVASTLLLAENTLLQNNHAFERGGGIYNALGTVTLQDVTLSGNTTNFNAGGIYNFKGVVNMTHTELRNNRSEVMGGMQNVGGTVTMAQAVLRDNSGLECGGIGNSGAGSMTLTDTVLSNNSADNLGGGICNSAALTLTRVTLRDNSVSGSGAGLWNDKDGKVVLSESTIDGNTAVDGGGISNDGSLAISATTISSNAGGGVVNTGELRISNSTFSGNFGSAVKNGGTAALTYVTFAGNKATSGSAIYHTGLGAGDTLTVQNVIFDPGAGGANCLRAAGSSTAITSLGHNLSSDASCNLIQSGDQQNTAVLLGPLAANGGPTLTHLPLEGSPAIDGGACVTGLMTDQRGLPRPQGATCDIGAAEVPPGGAVFLPFVQG